MAGDATGKVRSGVRDPLHGLDAAQIWTLERLRGYPLARGVKWPQVVGLLHALGDVSAERGNTFRVTLDGRSEIFEAPRHARGAVPSDDLVKLRHFLLPVLLTSSGVSTLEVHHS